MWPGARDYVRLVMERSGRHRPSRLCSLPTEGAFTHLALIEAVSLLIASELAEDVKSAGWDPAASTQVRSG